MNEFEKFSMKQLIEIILANIKFIVAVTTFFVIAAFIYSEAMVIPMYRASVSLYVNNIDSNTKFESKIAGADITASQMLVPTCVEIVKSNRMLNEVADNDDHAYSAAAIGRMVTTNIIDNTEIFKITITCSNPDVAAQIANTFAEVAPNVIGKVINASSVKVIDYAIPSNVKVSPNVAMNTILGFIIGVLLSCAFIALREIFDVRIKNESDLERDFEYPILGIIPKIGLSNGGQESYYYRNNYYRNNYYRNNYYKYSRGGSYYGRENK